MPPNNQSQCLCAASLKAHSHAWQVPSCCPVSMFNPGLSGGKAFENHWRIMAIVFAFSSGKTMQKLKENLHWQGNHVMSLWSKHQHQSACQSKWTEERMLDFFLCVPLWYHKQGWLIINLPFSETWLDPWTALFIEAHKWNGKGSKRQF